MSLFSSKAITSFNIVIFLRNKKKFLKQNIYLRIKSAAPNEANKGEGVSKTVKNVPCSQPFNLNYTERNFFNISRYFKISLLIINFGKMLLCYYQIEFKKKILRMALVTVN